MSETTFLNHEKMFLFCLLKKKLNVFYPYNTHTFNGLHSTVQIKKKTSKYLDEKEKELDLLAQFSCLYIQI